MRLHPDDRKDQILQAALSVCEKAGGWSSLTRTAVASKADCADALVSRYFGTMVAFRRTIMRAAVRNTNLSIIAQGVVAGDKVALKAPEGLRKQALQSIGG